MSPNGTGKLKLYSRKKQKSTIYLKKLTKKKRVVQSHTNMKFRNKRCLDGSRKKDAVKKRELRRQRIRRATSEDLNKVLLLSFLFHS